MGIKLLFMAFLAAFLSACGGVPAANTNANSNLNVNSTAAGGNIPTNANVANTTVNTSSNAKPTVDNSPKRISFGKGQNWGTSNITLSVGSSQRFIVSAKSGQTMDVEVSSKETSVNLIKGKAQTEEDFGFLTAQLQANGDYVFEVKNSSKKEIKTSVKVMIEGDEKVEKETKKKVAESEIDESDATIAEDEDVLPPPTETPKKKGN